MIIFFNCYFSLHFFRVHNNNCSIDRNNRDDQTTIILFTQDWMNFFWIAVTWSVLPFISQSKQSNECTWKRTSLPSRNLYKCKQVAWSVAAACLSAIFYTTLCCWLFTSLSPFYILMLLLYLCLFIDHVNKPIIILVFAAYVDYLRKPFPFS